MATMNEIFERIEELKRLIPIQEKTIETLLNSIFGIQNPALQALEEAETPQEEQTIKDLYAIDIDDKLEQLDAEFKTYESYTSELATLLSSTQEDVDDYNEKLLGGKINSQIKIKSL